MRRLAPITSLMLAAAWVVLHGCGDDGTSGATTSGSTSTPTTDPTTGTTMPSTTDETDSSTGIDPDSGSSDSGTPAFCPETHRCVPVAPEGWSGPVAGHDGQTEAEPVPCGSAYPDEAVTAFAELVAPPADCSCTCDDPVGVTCDNSMQLAFHGDDSTCSGSPTTIQIFSGICNNPGVIFPADSYWLTQPLEASGGSCTPSGSMEKSEPFFETRVTVCGAEVMAEGCAADRVCAPRPEEPGTPLCVWQEGEHDCPSSYPERRLLHEDWDDQRACEDCTCGSPVGLCDAAVVNLLSNVCNPPVTAVLQANGECQHVSGSVRSATLMLGQPNAFCQPSKGQPTGGATGTGPITLCCEG